MYKSIILFVSFEMFSAAKDEMAMARLKFSMYHWNATFILTNSEYLCIKCFKENYCSVVFYVFFHCFPIGLLFARNVIAKKTKKKAQLLISLRKTLNGFNLYNLAWKYWKYHKANKLYVLCKKAVLAGKLKVDRAHFQVQSSRKTALCFSCLFFYYRKLHVASWWSG